MLHLRLVQIMNFSSKSRTEGFLRRLAETSKDLEVRRRQGGREGEQGGRERGREGGEAGV